MKTRIEALGVTLDVPEGSEVTSDGSVFAPDGVEFAVYTEPSNIDVALRKEIIEGRSPVSLFGDLAQTADGWLIQFETEDGELGFELGRRRPDRCVVFWGDRMREAAAREQAIAIAQQSLLV